MVNAHTESSYNRWIVDEGHLDRVWMLAESASKIMGIDQVRIDIFIQRGHPERVSINENSISSGMGYRSHFEFMPRVWAAGHVHKWYSEWKSQIPVYELSYPDKTCPNQKLIPKPPPYY